MNIIISNSSGLPIYEQICRQIKGAIATGKLRPGEPLPSIRALARDLRISVITTKRAYNDLEQEGFIETITGKGSFVAAKDTEVIREGNLRIAEEYLAKAAELAKKSGIPLKELVEVLELIYNGE